MIREILRKVLSATLVTLFSAPVLAGVEGTHHDMTLITGRSEKGVCSFCHLPHNAVSANGLFSRKGAHSGELGEVGAFCYSCHDGTVSPTAMIEAPNGVIGIETLTDSHGFDFSNMYEKSAGIEDKDNIRASDLINPEEVDTTLDQIECTTCHDVHNNTFPPFMREPMEELCVSCHSGSDFLGMRRWTEVDDIGDDNGSHPIDMKVAATRYDRTRAMEEENSFHKPHRLFDTPVLTPEELGDPNKHWDMGGHLTGRDKLVSCVTCHSPHMPATNLLVASAAEKPEEVLCSGCHGDGDNPANPGVTQWYHPVFEESLPPYVHDHSMEPDTVPANLKQGDLELYVEIPETFPIESDGRLTCTSCHVAHNGRKGTKSLIENGEDWLATVVCTECHQITHMEKKTGGGHHVTSAANMGLGRVPALAPWAWGPGQPGDLSDGLHCVDCHTEWARSAHNW